MMENACSLAEAIIRYCGEKTAIINRVSVSGGDINRAYALDLSDGNRLFMKANSRSNLGFFEAEAAGLSAIRATNTVRTPDVVAVGTDGDDAFLLLEYITPATGNRASSEELGRNLARMHMANTDEFVKDGRFGFAADNYIGAGKQINTPKETWIEFFTECRLIPQLDRAAKFFDRGERRDIDAFLNRIDRYIIEPEHPSLLHGDLWAGNYMIDHDGHSWLIDPAVYVGHAEADLAMTELFGGFDRTFYDAYSDTAGIDPGYRDRKDIYNLYHLLNHLNLFGSGYLHSVKAVLRRYV